MWVVGCGFVGANCVTIWLLWCLLVVCVYGSGCRLRVVVMRWCLRLRGFCAALYVGWFAFSVVAMVLVYVLVWLGLCMVDVGCVCVLLFGFVIVA